MVPGRRIMSQQPDKIICSMVRVGKYYNKKPVLQEISLSYFYGAKIGVLGANAVKRCSASWSGST
jgi:sulfate-transporting ATPase